MSKKSRRSKARQRPRPVKATHGGISQQLKPAVARPQSPPRIAPEAQTHLDRYQHVIPEVKYIGILAGAMILILIVLSFTLG